MKPEKFEKGKQPGMNKPQNPQQGNRPTNPNAGGNWQQNQQQQRPQQPTGKTDKDKNKGGF